MTTYYPHKIRLSDGQKVSLARAFGSRRSCYAQIQEQGADWWQ